MPWRISFSSMSELTFRVPQGRIENIFPELALYGSKHYYARTDTVFFPISEVSESTVSLMQTQTS